MSPREEMSGYCEEELKMIHETHKILAMTIQYRINATCVRVPVLRAHSEAINVEFTYPMRREDGA
jgi:aspartate-semialdehyde dehydrogenase